MSKDIEFNIQVGQAINLAHAELLHKGNKIDEDTLLEVTKNKFSLLTIVKDTMKMEHDKMNKMVEQAIEQQQESKPLHEIKETVDKPKPKFDLDEVF